MNKGVSVIICCYNSVSRIKQTLEHISKQVVASHIPWEVIIVDNNSNDRTAKYAKEIWQELDCNVPFFTTFEPQAGLSFARRKGISSAQYEYLLFCDDDNWLDKNYVESAYKILESNPKIGVLGGQSKVTSNNELPFWFSSYQKDYAVGVQNIENGDITFRRFVWGAGVMLRKSVLEIFYNLNVHTLLTGRKEKKVLSGDDSEICFWFIWSGYRLWYDEDLVLYHFMPQERLTKQYFKKLIKGHQEAQKFLIIYNIITNYHPNSLFRYFFLSTYFRLKTIISTDALDYSHHKKIIKNYYVITQYFTKNRG